ncbi:hypothetical protein [Acrocarpospora pleiomorpha]|nr:hypothetical protein [Acrocarpospora pleiomorpha]
MTKLARLVVTAVTLAALAATGTASASASASASDSPPTPDAAKSSSATVKPDGKSKTAEDTDFAALAAKLGVTTDRLDAALLAAKTSLANSTDVTPDTFYAAVAANLGLPVAQVQDGLGPLDAKPAPGDDHGKQDKKEGPQGSPFTTDAAAASVAAALGVDQAEAKAALAAVVELGSAGGIDPTSKAFGDIAASLGVSSEQLKSALGDLKRSLAND